MIDYKIWCTYHDKELLNKYNLKETDNFKPSNIEDIKNMITKKYGAETFRSFILLVHSLKIFMEFLLIKC